jgi:hypothetical protein
VSDQVQRLVSEIFNFSEVIMVVGKVGEWIAILPKGMAVILDNDDIRDSAKAYLDSSFDSVRREDILKVVTEVNSNEYPGFEMWERPDGRWTLERCTR